jgi:DNA-binding MarR family transcriptional regulator
MVSPATATAASERRISEGQRQLWRSLTAAHGRIEGELEKALQEGGLPPLAWFNVLDPICAAPRQALRPRDLGCGVQISRSGLTRLLDRMESAGVIVRRRCDEDRRGSYIGVTEAGAEMAAGMRDVIETELAMILGDLFEDAEAAQARDLLTRVSSTD